MQGGKYADAAAEYARVVEAEPANAVARVRFGRALLLAGDFAKAAEVEAKAADMPGVKHRAQFNLACALTALGDKDGAGRALAAAVAAGFQSDTMIENEPLLAPLHDHPAYAAALASIRAANDKPEHHALDFWIGSWDVYDAQGSLIGRNTIESQERGCLIAEHWIPVGADGTPAPTGSGRSINFFDPTDGRWKQVWVNDSGNVLRIDGTLVKGAMWFEGDAVSRQGTTQHSRTVLTPLPGGRVRQSIHFTNDQGATWTLVFDAVYVQHGTAFDKAQFPAAEAPGGVQPG